MLWVITLIEADHDAAVTLDASYVFFFFNMRNVANNLMGISNAWIIILLKILYKNLFVPKLFLFMYRQFVVNFFFLMKGSVGSRRILFYPWIWYIIFYHHYADWREISKLRIVDVSYNHSSV